MTSARRRSKSTSSGMSHAEWWNHGPRTRAALLMCCSAPTSTQTASLCRMRLRSGSSPSPSPSPSPVLVTFALALARTQAGRVQPRRRPVARERAHSLGGCMQLRLGLGVHAQARGRVRSWRDARRAAASSAPTDRPRPRAPLHPPLCRPLHSLTLSTLTASPPSRRAAREPPVRSHLSPLCPCAQVLSQMGLGDEAHYAHSDNVRRYAHAILARIQRADRQGTTHGPGGHGSATHGASSSDCAGCAGCAADAAAAGSAGCAAAAAAAAGAAGAAAGGSEVRCPGAAAVAVGTAACAAAVAESAGAAGSSAGR